MTKKNIKALSIKQPWAWAIVSGYKAIENRTWKTKFRGEFLIHASKQFDKKGYEWIKENASKIGTDKLPEPKEFLTCGIVGKAKFVDVVEESESPWFFDPVGFVLEDQTKIPFIHYKGHCPISV